MGSICSVPGCYTVTKDCGLCDIHFAKSDRDLNIGLKKYTGVVRRIVIEEYDATAECFTEEEWREMVQDKSGAVVKKTVKVIEEFKFGAVVVTEVK